MDLPTSNIFEGFKTLGLVTGPKPFLIRQGKDVKDTRIVTIVGRSFHTYTINTNLVEVSIPHEAPISAIISDAKHLYSASGRSILVWGRGSKKLIVRLDRGHQADVVQLIKFGNSRIIAIDEDNILFNWNWKEKEILNIVSFDKQTFDITSMCHPFGYEDKILLGSRQGSLQLWNVVSEKMLYEFKGWNSSITCIVQSPIDDVVGIGFEDGYIRVYNIKYDEIIVKMLQDYGPVTSLTFRLDGLPYLVSTSKQGHLCVWNLEKKSLSTQIRNAHRGSISCCKFIRNECLLVTNGDDNDLKIWTMDRTDGGGTLLRQRCGHSYPPTFVRLYGDSGFHVLSSGDDSTLKCFHIFSERLNRNLGTAKFNPKSRSKNPDNKLKPISYFCAEQMREKEWDNIVACHKNSSTITTWSFDKCRLGRVIEQPTFKNHNVYANRARVSPCGNFLVIGFSNGFIFKYNIQSGIFRFTFEDPTSNEHKAHSASVTGLCIDILSLNLVSASTDRTLKLWNFKSGILKNTIDLNKPVANTELHVDNLLAIALEDGEIQIYDLDTVTCVRKFEMTSETMDLTFSPDARWLVVAYADKTIRTWDISLGKLIDQFSLSKQCISLSMSSTGEYLATVQEGSLGVSIWSNYTLYEPSPIRTIDIYDATPMLDMPTVRCDERSEEDEDGNDDQPILRLGVEAEPEYISPDQLHKEMIQLSGLPTSRWRNLLHVEEIRNKQRIEEEEKNAEPLKVPFFMPIKDGLRPSLDKESLLERRTADIQANVEESRIQDLRLLSSMSKLLLNCLRTGQYEPFIEKLKDLGPSATDSEIRLLGKNTCNSELPILGFLEAIEELIDSNMDFELACSWLALCLKIHFEDIENDDTLQKKCIEMRERVTTKWGRVKHKFDQIFCVMNFIRSSVL